MDLGSLLIVCPESILCQRSHDGVEAKTKTANHTTPQLRFALKATKRNSDFGKFYIHSVAFLCSRGKLCPPPQPSLAARRSRKDANSTRDSSLRIASSERSEGRRPPVWHHAITNIPNRFVAKGTLGVTVDALTCLQVF